MWCLQAYKRWKGIELKLTDAANEANDNVRYLTTLERAFEVGGVVLAISLCCVAAAASPADSHWQPAFAIKRVMTHVMLHAVLLLLFRSCMVAAPSKYWTACAA